MTALTAGAARRPMAVVLDARDCPGVVFDTYNEMHEASSENDTEFPSTLERLNQ